MNPRLRRLRKDHEKLQALAMRSSFVAIEKTQGDPPTEYILILSCKGIESLSHKKKPQYSEFHRLRIVLHDAYPRKKPGFSLLTPIFHPNVSDGGAVCIGDEGDAGFAPSMGLDDIVIRIVQMIRYENFGADNPYNRKAAKWALKHRHLLPLDTRQIVSEDLIEAISILDEIQIVRDGRVDLLNEITIL